MASFRSPLSTAHLEGGMIVGNATWTAALAGNWKWPLYYLEIPEFGILILSFLPALVIIG
jgi:hypothetical protein